MTQLSIRKDDKMLIESCETQKEAIHVSSIIPAKAITNEQIITLSHELGRIFSTRASHYDKTNQFPKENFELLKKHHFLSIMIPKSKGGMGADFLTYTRALEAMSKGDAATALTFNMHNIAVGSLAELDFKGQKNHRIQHMQDFIDWVYTQVITHQKVFASATSEPNIGAHLSKIKTTYEANETGFIINGIKNWVSMAGYADYYVVAAKKKEENPSSPPAISYLIVEKENPNAQIKYTWDVLGMRATSTNPVYFKNCWVPKRALFLGSEGMALFKVAREPHWLVGGYIGVYLGICSATLDFVIHYLKQKKIPGTQIPLSQNERILHKVGELSSQVMAAKQSVYYAAKLVKNAPGTPQTNEAIHQAKYIVSELGPSLTSEAIRLCGGSTLSKSMPLERYYRESRCAGLMPASSDECLAYLGKCAFGVDLSKPNETYW
jgi:alkylation response protein AidB-like acyl-CoA dehydrogenase